MSVPALAGPAQAVLIGGFEVDGNQVSDGNVDWTTVGDVSVVHDAIGNADASVFDGGDSENDNDGVAPESTWDIGSPGTPSGKSDIGNVLVASFKSGGDTWAAFGWDRVGDTGTGRYYIELNQATSSGVMPTRTTGDVRIIVAINGSDLLTCQSVETWAGQWTNSQACGGNFQIVVNSGTIADNFDSPNVPLEANTFLEGVINLSDFGLTTCPVAGFQSIHFRSQEGGENGDTSSLKDFATGPIDIPSDCGAITIEKKVNGTLGSDGAGATFMISPDPTPGSSDPYLIVVTGSDGTVTVTAMPGDYTVRELAPPAGYLLPVDDSEDINVAESETETVIFNDVDGSLKFTKYYEGDPPSGEGASFTVTRIKKWSYDTNPAGGIDDPVLVDAAAPTINVTDNGANDDDATMGKIEINNLPGGKYTIAETSPPDGWMKDPGNSPVDFTIGPRDSNAERNISLNASGDPATFSNLLRPIAIQVVKTESVPGIPEDTAYLAGVTFKLYVDDGDHVFEGGGDDALVSAEVTDSNGEILWSSLSWQDDYWLEEIKKTGYEIGLSPNPTLINIDQANPPTDNDTVITVPVDNPREEISITLTKVDGSDHDVKLSGGTFQLWRDTGDGLFDSNDDYLLGSTSAANGEVTFSKDDYNLPWGYTYFVYESAAPVGYQLMSPNPITVDATSPDVGNTTIDLGEIEDPQQPVYLTLVKIVDNGETDGTATVADFPLSADGPVSMTDVISGTQDASQQVQAGTYELSEGSGPEGYTASDWSCVGNGDDGADGSVTLALGDDVTCTITNTAQPGTYVYSKSSDPVSGSTVDPGDTVTYTVTVTKTGGVDSTNVVINDDLSDVLDNATLVPGSINASTGSADIDGFDQLTWTIPVLSGTETVSYAVTVDEGEWGVTLHNVVTSPEGSCEGVCETTHVTPHWTLYKTSDPASGSTVYPGDQVDYTLTVHNDSDAVVSGATVTDDLSDVLDNATLVLPLDSALNLVDTTLTWTLPTLEPDETVTVSYSVVIGEDEWGETLHNVATPDQPSGECIEPGCETTHEIPPVTTLVVQKVDFETGESLEGATFQLWTDNEPYFDADGIPGNEDDVIGAEDTTFGDPVVTDADGLAKWAELLMGSHFIIEETVPPAGYDLPNTTLMGIELNEQNFVPMGEMAAILFRDPALGQIAILSKKQFQDTSAGNASGNWQQINGQVPFGERIKYEITIKATGNKMFHDVTVTDYVPGYNPKDNTSTNKATYEAGSAACVGFTCTTHYNASTGLVTWYIGDVQNVTGKVSFVVKFPTLPDPIPFDNNDHYEDTIWNVGYLAWDELDTSTSGPGLPGENVLHFKLTSNQVTATAATDALPVETLPPTGSSRTVEIGGVLGSAFIVVGCWLMAMAIRRRRLIG